MVTPLQSPEKELRFTRSAQGQFFWLLAAVFFTVSITLLASAVYRSENPGVPHPLWALIPLVLGILICRVAFHLTRHAYLILTPLGIEVFPFLRPAAGMQLVAWSQIHGVEVNERLTQLTLHFNAEKTSGIHLSLKPISREKRSLLAKAVLGRLSPRSSHG